jgi:hypothetical protein
MCNELSRKVEEAKRAIQPISSCAIWAQKSDIPTGKYVNMRIEPGPQSQAAEFQFTESWHTLHRFHSSLGYVSPVNYERAHHQNAASRA